MNLWKSLAGMVEMELTSASVEETLSAIRAHNISVFRVKAKGDLTVRFWIYRKDAIMLESLCDKRGEKWRILHKKGLYWELRRLLRRPVLVTGIFVLLLSAWMLPRYVLFVQVEGNQAVPNKKILEAAAECGIRFGAARGEVRSERTKNALLSKVPQLQWAGVNTRGCVAVISVRERTATDQAEETKTVSSIVANRDGVIVSCTATRGNLVCAPGQAVREGELLISGYTDCGISIQATRAAGEVYAQTIRDADAVAPRNWFEVGEEKGRVYLISLLIGKKRINLWKDSGIWDGTCGRMYKEYYVTLPGGFSLPIALCVDTYISYELETLPQPQTWADRILCDFTNRSLQQQMVAGEILSGEYNLIEEESLYRFQGNYVCREMIGRVYQEKMGEQYGKTD